MLTALLIIGLLFTLSGAVAAAFAVGHLYGTNQLLNKQILDGRRRERRHQRDLRTLHNKLSEKAGFGSLYRRVYRDDGNQTQAPRRTVVPPSKTIEDLKADLGQVGKAPRIDRTERVPPTIAKQFLAAAGPIPTTTSSS